MLGYTFPGRDLVNYGGSNKRGQVKYKKILNLKGVVNKWKWVVVFPKIWCCPPLQLGCGEQVAFYLENICGHTVMSQIPRSAKYDNQNFAKTVVPFYMAYKNNKKKCQRTFTLKCTQIKIQQYQYFKIQGERKNSKFKKIGKFSCVDKKVIQRLCITQTLALIK